MENFLDSQLSHNRHRQPLSALYQMVSICIQTKPSRSQLGLLRHRDDLFLGRQPSGLNTRCLSKTRCGLQANELT